MKKLLLGLTFLTSMSSFALEPLGGNCLVRKVKVSTNVIASTQELTVELEKAGFNLSNDVVFEVRDSFLMNMEPDSININSSLLYETFNRDLCQLQDQVIQADSDFLDHIYQNYREFRCSQHNKKVMRESKAEARKRGISFKKTKNWIRFNNKFLATNELGGHQALTAEDLGELLKNVSCI